MGLPKQQPEFVIKQHALHALFLVEFQQFKQYAVHAFELQFQFIQQYAVAFPVEQLQ